MAERLKLSDPLVLERRRRRGDRDLEPDWLVHLRGHHRELQVRGHGQRGGPLRPSQLLWTQGRQALTSASPQHCGGPRGRLSPRKHSLMGEGVALSYPPHRTPPSANVLPSRVETFSCVPLGDSGTLSRVTQPPFSAVLENTLFDHQSFRLSMCGTVAHSGPVSLSCNVGQLLKRLPDLSFFFFFVLTIAKAAGSNCHSNWNKASSISFLPLSLRKGQVDFFF